MLRLNNRSMEFGTAFLLFFLVVRAAHAIDLTGSWWVHADPYAGGSSFTAATFDVIQSGNVLAITNVRAEHRWATGLGNGGGTIDPVTGEIDASYGYTILEPILALLDATARPGWLLVHRLRDGEHRRHSPGTGPVVGIRLTGDPAVCGDSRLEPGETCDDGNLDSDDGCSATCEREPRCGDRIPDPGEDCDDGNLVDGDDCWSTPSPACTAHRRSAFHSPIQQLGELRALIHAVAEEQLVVLLALEVDVHVAFPGEADAAVELHRAAGAERGHVRRAGLRHARVALGASAGSVSMAQAAV